MTDTTQGADAPNDNALFEEATSATTLEKFENPPPLPEPPDPAKPVEPVKPDPAKPDPAKPEDTALVPAGRLREEAEARRKAERERDELIGMVRATQQQRQPQQPDQPAKPDMFENPSGFVKAELQPYLEQIRADFQNQREAMSLDWAMRSHGGETVSKARQALEEGMSRGDPTAWGTYNRAMQSHDPYGVIVNAHRERETLRTINGDLDGYRKSILEEALNDPEYRKRVIEAAKGQASAAGNSVARPAKAAQSSPSLGDIGAGGRDEQVIEPSDNDLFRQAVTAKRR